MTSGIVEIAVVGTCLTSLGILWLHQRKLVRLQQRFERLQYELLVANNTSIGLGQQVLALEKKVYGKHATQTPSHNPSTNLQTNKHSSKITPLTVVDNTSAMASLGDTTPSDEVYQKSRQLLYKGVPIEDVVKQSGLSYSEVSLMKALAQ